MIARFLDYYFKRPIIWDFVFGVLFSSFLIWILEFKNWKLPKEDYLIEMISDISNISLTSAGFILTLMTLLITFKSSSNLRIEEASEDNSRFEIFFASKLYFKTVTLLKNAIKSLFIISLFGYLIKLLVQKDYQIFMFFSCVLLLSILILTLGRCLLILGQVLKLQKHRED